MSCRECGTECGSINPGMKPEGAGSVLLVLDQIESRMDYNGSYYAGAVGQVLSGVLERTGLQKEDCTVCSVKRCLGFSGKQTQDFTLSGNYQTVITFGEEAFKYLCGRSGLKDKRGKEFLPTLRFAALPSVYPTYDLRLVQKIPNYRNVVITDIMRALSAGKVAEHIEWEWWNGQELPNSEVYAYDIETIDENGNYTELATQCAVAGDSFCFVSRPNAESSRNLSMAITRKLRSSGVLVGHNSWTFDVPRTRLSGVDIPLGKDTMVLAYLEDETQPKGLEALCVKHLGIKGWKDEFEHPLGSDGFALYNARDVVYTLRLYRKLVAILGDRVKIADSIMAPAQEAFLRMSARGMHINPIAVARERANSDKAVTESLAELTAITGPDFKPGSSKQVASFLRGQGVRLANSEKGHPVVDAKVLKELAGE